MPNPKLEWTGSLSVGRGKHCLAYYLSNDHKTLHYEPNLQAFKATVNLGDAHTNNDRSQNTWEHINNICVAVENMTAFCPNKNINKDLWIWMAPSRKIQGFFFSENVSRCYSFHLKEKSRIMGSLAKSSSVSRDIFYYHWKYTVLRNFIWAFSSYKRWTTKTMDYFCWLRPLRK